MRHRRQSLLSKIIVGVSLAVLAGEAFVLAPVVLLSEREAVEARRETAALVARVLVHAPERDAADMADQWLWERQLAQAGAATWDGDLRLTAGRPPAAGTPEGAALASALARARERGGSASVEAATCVVWVEPVPGGGYVGVCASLEPLQGKLAAHVLIAMGLLLVVLMVTGAATIAVVYRHILRPLRALTAANRALVEGDEGGALVPDEAVPDDELGDAIRSRNEIYGRMLEYQRSIREKNEILSRQSVELKRWALELERRVREKSEELLRARDRILDSEKLAATGRLAAGVAHEINNPLASIAGYAEDLLTLAEDPELRRHEAFKDFPDSLAVIQEQAFRCKRIIRQLLTFARPSEFTPEPLQLAQVVADILPLVEHKARGRDIAIVVDERAGTPCVLADRTHLMQVLVNLIENAFDAIAGETGKIAVATRSVERPAAAAANGNGREGGEVAVEVSDTGVGIPAEHLRKIFDPFFTTKPVGRGTGLGLSICHSIVSRMGGRIEVESEVGKGTRFTVVLPAAAPEPAAVER